MRVVVTGASGYLARLAIPTWLAKPEVSSVLGLDRLPAPPEAAQWGHRYEHRRMELGRWGALDWQEVLAGCDQLLHLAFEVAPPAGQEVRASNWTGQATLLREAMAAPRRVVVASAIAAYGFGHGHDPHQGLLDEAAERRPGTGVGYAEAKQAMERLLDELEANSPATLVRLRPTNVVGPQGDLHKSKPLLDPWLWVPAVPHPLRQQFLHEEDWARAAALAFSLPAGAYNVAPVDWILVEEMAQLLGQRLMRLPLWALRPMAEAAHRTGLSPFGADWLNFLEQPPIIVSSAKLQALGWAPRFRSHEALSLTVGALKARLA